MSETNITVVLTTGERITVPLNRYKVLPNGIVVLNADKGKYTIFSIGVAYIFQEKIDDEEEDKKGT